MRNKTHGAWNIEIVFTCRAFIYQLIAAAVRIYTHLDLGQGLDGQVCTHQPFQQQFSNLAALLVNAQWQRSGLSDAIIVTYWEHPPAAAGGTKHDTPTLIST